MTYQEIANAIRKDWENELYSCYVHCFGMRQKYGRFILKNVKPEEFRFLGRREKLTKNKNKYVFLFYTQGRTQYKHEGPLRSLFCVAYSGISMELKDSQLKKAQPSIVVINLPY